MRRRGYKCKKCSLKWWQDVKEAPSCPDCGFPYDRPSPNYLELGARIYGTEAVPKWNWGLGAWTTGKTDYRRRYESKQLVPRDG